MCVPVPWLGKEGGGCLMGPDEQLDPGFQAT